MNVTCIFFFLEYEHCLSANCSKNRAIDSKQSTARDSMRGTETDVFYDLHRNRIIRALELNLRFSENNTGESH